MTHPRLGQCSKCGCFISPPTSDLCDPCFTLWIRKVLIFTALAIVLVTLATWAR